MLKTYAAISAIFGVLGMFFTPGYNPTFDFGISLILLGLDLGKVNDGKV